MMASTIFVSSNPADHAAFASISAAAESIPKTNDTPVTIELAPGIYYEKLTIDRPYVTIAGTGAAAGDTVIRFDDYAFAVMPDGKKRGTFRSYSVFIDAHDVTLRNLTIENASGDSATHGQAIALYADGDRILVDSCRLLGHQDTLFTGPLPPKELQPDGFIGPKQFAPRINGRQYYKNCYICGDVDFIFGSATAYFEDCTIESLRRFPESPEGNAIQGYVTAASTPEGQEYGYVFSRCRLVSGDCPAASVYLGRPWRDYARTVFLHCELGKHIHPAGFHDWNKENARANVLYAEYANYPAGENGADASCSDENCRVFTRRADFVCVLDAGQAEHFSREKVLGGNDGWMCGDR
jgi:pectinesterase